MDENSAGDVCPKCGSKLNEPTTTASGKKMQSCSAGQWNPQTRATEGCDYIKWMIPEPQKLEEKCPKCGADLVLAVTRFGKKMKKCSTSVWNKETKTVTGCDYIEWINGTKEELPGEVCPKCDNPLVLYITANGKRMKKCSTSGWDKEARKATGCDYVQWLNG